MQSANRPLVFIKIGGSLITDKKKSFFIKKNALKVIAKEIKKATELGKQLVIGHGAGSFAHVPAKKYQTHRGIINDLSYKGIAEVANVACQLNRIVVEQLLTCGVNAISVSPLSIMLAKNHNLDFLSTEALEKAISLGMVPVVYGDQILDKQIGCTIFSTEKVLGYLAVAFKKRGYVIERIIHCGQTNGVYDQDGQTIELINKKTFTTYQQVIGKSDGVDVTGGMLHKVQETLSLAEQGIPGLIIDGIEHGSLSKAVAGEKVLGTRIEA